MANLAQNQNQLAQTPMLGQVTMDPQPNTISAQIWPSSTAAVIVAGCSVKLIDSTPNNGPLLVDVVLNQTDGPIFGIIPYNARKNVYAPSDTVEVVGVNGVLMLKSYGAVARGANVTVRNPSALSTDPMVESSQTIGQYIAGIALGRAAAGSTLIKVQVRPAYVQTTGVIAVSA